MEKGAANHATEGSMPYETAKGLKDFLPPKSLNSNISVFKKSAIRRVYTTQQIKLCEQIQEQVGIMGQQEEDILNLTEELHELEKKYSSDTTLIMIIAVSAVVIVSGCPASAGTNAYTPYYYSEAGSTQSISYYTERQYTYYTGNGIATGNQISAGFANGPHYINYSGDGLYEYTDRGVVIKILEMDGTNSTVVKTYTLEFIIDAYGRYALDLPWGICRCLDCRKRKCCRWSSANTV